MKLVDTSAGGSKPAPHQTNESSNGQSNQVAMTTEDIEDEGVLNSFMINNDNIV